MARRNPTGMAVMATEWLLVSLAAVMIVARLYMRLGIKRQTFQASDAFICLAWITSVTTASFDIIFIRMGILHESVSVTLVGYTGTPEDIEFYNKLNWIRHLPFYTTFYLCKFAILSFYLDLFPLFLRKTRMLVWVTLGYCVCALIVTLATNIFLCWPLERNWVLDPEKKCYTHLPAVIFQIGFALHIAGELMIFALPFFMLRHIQMKLDVKIGVYGTFALGIVAIAFAFTRFFSVQLGETIPGQTRKYHSLTLVQLYSALDINVGLIVACLPSLRPYLRMFSQSAIVSRITSKISKDKSRGSKNASSEDGADVEMGSGRQHKKTGWTDICEDTVYESRSESPRGGAHDSDIELIQGSGHIGVAS